MNKFKIGELVLCRIYDNTLGFIERIKYEPITQSHVYFVRIDRTHVVEIFEENLYKIANASEFTILSKSTNVLAPFTCRQVASEILGQFELYGDMYYKLEDWLTSKLEGEHPDLPLGIEGEYLKCALRIEVRDWFDNMNAIDIESEQIESIVNSIINSYSRSVIDNEFIEATVKEYIENNNIKCEEI